MRRCRKRREGERERDRPKAAISGSLVLSEHIYFPLISNALVNFLSLFIASTCDLSLAACRKRENVQNGYFRESITTATGSVYIQYFSWQVHIKKHSHNTGSYYPAAKQPV